MKKIAEYDITDRGVDHAQYFQGHGTSFSDFDESYTGAGDNAVEAYDDAVEQAATSGWDVSALPTRPRGIRKSDRVRHVRGEDEDNEIYYYVSLRLKEKVAARVRGGARDMASVHDTRKRVRQPPRANDAEVNIWEERDRLHIEVRNVKNDQTIVEWWDDDARQMIEDGFFTAGGRLRGSVLDYCIETELLRA